MLAPAKRSVARMSWWTSLRLLRLIRAAPRSAVSPTEISFRSECQASNRPHHGELDKQNSDYECGKPVTLFASAR